MFNRDRIETLERKVSRLIAKNNKLEFLINNPPLLKVGQKYEDKIVSNVYLHDPIIMDGGLGPISDGKYFWVYEGVLPGCEDVFKLFPISTSKSYL